MATRRYRQRARAEDAARTRASIIEAVFDRIREAPTEPISVGGIAHKAGVARSTVYKVFGSRSGLFDAVGRELHERSGYASLLEAKLEADARSDLRAGFSAASEMFAANADIYRALRSMARLDAEAVGDIVHDMDEGRAAGMRRLVARFQQEGLLREGMSAADAVHVLWALSSFETFDALFTARGLSLQRTVTLLTETAEGAVLRPA